MLMLGNILSASLLITVGRECVAVLCCETMSAMENILDLSLIKIGIPSTSGKSMPQSGREHLI